MQKQKIKLNKAKTIIATTLIITIAMGCSTTKKRDKELIKTLELQNATISEAINQNLKETVDTSSNLNVHQKALKAVYTSNNVVISKLKPKNKKECNCGKNERVNDR